MENAVHELGTGHIKVKRKVFTKMNITLYLMLLPTVLSYLIFHYIPMPGLYLAFSDFRVSGFRDYWVGFENFEYIFNLGNFWQSFGNTWIFIILGYVFVFPAAIILALLLNEMRGRFFKRTIQTVSCIPHFVSWVIVGGIWITLLSPTYGYINQIIKLLGGEPYYFLIKASIFPYLLTFIRIWKDVGYNAIIYIAALSSIDNTLYESSVIDGAGRWKQTIHITLPGMKSTILVMLILSFSGVLNLFDPVYVFQNPALLSIAETLDTYIYKVGIRDARYSVATAVGLFKSVISFALVIMTNIVSKYITEDKETILW